ncbi:MAG: hypothetical protein LRZ87_02535, partial [Methanocellales archaeon]|nr:hypothetical protein [Methanocellales archaeon]
MMQEFRYFEAEFSKQSEKWKHLGPKFSREIKTLILQQVKIIDDFFEGLFNNLPALSKGFRKNKVRKTFVLFERWQR